MCGTVAQPGSNSSITTSVSVPGAIAANAGRSVSHTARIAAEYDSSKSFSCSPVRPTR